MNKDFAPVWEEASHVSHHDSAPAQQRKSPAIPLKQIVTIRLDVDTLEWFKGAGPGYQTRINQLLRQHMDAERAKAKAE
jgi:uncharacterized protein (DUF4415 family)